MAALLSAAAPAGYRVTVAVEHVRNAQGVVGVLVCHTAQGWPEHCSAALRANARAAHTGVVDITIPDLPAGEDAVVARHDAHTNTQLDRTWLGVPVAPWGMSDHPPYRLAAPSCEAARFRLAQDLRIWVRRQSRRDAASA